jgi:hypothetical protein
MPRKRIDQVEGMTELFSTTSALLNYVYSLTESLEDTSREIVLDYLKLRNSCTWNKSSIQDLITLSRYEISCRKLSLQLDELNREEVLNPKKIKEVTSLLNNLLNQCQLIRGNLGLTLIQLHGDTRDRREADQAQAAVIDILTPKQLKVDEVTGIDAMRSSARTKLLKMV